MLKPNIGFYDMSARRNRNKKLEKKIAKSRIEKLFKLAEEKALQGDLNLADRYITIARKISMKYQIKMPKEYKRCFCKHCYSYLLPDVTSKVRINHGKIIIYCKNCKKYTRIPIY